MDSGTVEPGRPHRRSVAAHAGAAACREMELGRGGKPSPLLAPPDAPTVAVRHPALMDNAPSKEFTGRLVTDDPVKVVPQVSGMPLRRALAEEDMDREGQNRPVRDRPDAVRG